ncbi:Hypothetical protein MVR_LOCUS389 [uncultured virus]|nr:Hypothetical protein MVR_LOCUS389 [uncultured virus]
MATTETESFAYEAIPNNPEYCKAIMTITTLASESNQSTTTVIEMILTTCNKWINAPWYIKQYDRKWDNWKSSDRSKKFIQHVLAKHSISSCMNIILGKKFPGNTGSYVHPDLMQSITSWTSPVHAIRDMRLVAFIQQTTAVNVIPSLLLPISQQVNTIQEAVILVANNTLQVTTHPGDRNKMLIIDTHPDTSENPIMPSANRYRVHRIIQDSMNSTITWLKERRPNHEILLTLDTAYAVLAWRIVRRKLVRDGQIKMRKGGYIELRTVTIDQVIEQVNQSQERRMKDVNGLIARTANMTLAQGM